MNLLKRGWAYEPTILAVVLPGLAAFIAGAGLYLNGAGNGGPATSGAGLVAIALGFLVRTRVFAPANVPKLLSLAQVVEGLLSRLEQLRPEPLTVAPAQLIEAPTQPVHVHIDGQEVFQAMQTHALKNEQRNSSNNLDRDEHGRFVPRTTKVPA